MPAFKTPALRRIRFAFLALSALAVPALCLAARRVPVFVVDVGGQNAPALQQAMRAALVRATGHPEAAADPVFASLVAQAAQYVLSYQHGPQGQLQVMFNGPAIDRAINGLGRSVWTAERPFTLVVLSPMPDQAGYEADHAALEQTAEIRGLPISVMPLPVTDGNGQLLGQSALLALVHRFGADQLLVGQAVAAGDRPAAGIGVQPSPGAATAGSVQANPPSGTSPEAPLEAPQWQWTLVTPFMRRTFAGRELTAGIDDTVDLLAPSPALTGNRLTEVQVRIEGISTLSDYAHVELMLAAMPGVSRSDVGLVQGDAAVFEVQARGGAPAVARMLAGSPHFSPLGSGSGALVYRYRPSSPAAPSSETVAPATAAARPAPGAAPAAASTH